MKMDLFVTRIHQIVTTRIRFKDSSNNSYFHLGFVSIKMEGSKLSLFLFVFALWIFDSFLCVCVLMRGWRLQDEATYSKQRSTFGLRETGKYLLLMTSLKALGLLRYIVNVW